MVETFLSLEMEDPSLDLQRYMKEDVLPLSEY